MPRAPKQTADELRDALDAAERECDSLRRQLAEVAYEHKMSKMLNHGALAENKMLEEKVRAQQETIRVLNVAESKLARTEAALEVAERRIEELEKDRIKEYERTAEAISEARNGWDVEAKKKREMERMEWEAKGREFGREEVVRLTKERDAWKAKYTTAMAENARLEARFATVRSLVADTSPAAPAEVAMKREEPPEPQESEPEPEPVSPPVRKRGRPPRQAVVEEPESEVEPDPIESPPVRRRVGRPPKAAAQTQAEPESPPVRKRGRPRKVVEAEPEDEMEPESPPVRRPVGRPRKTAPALLAEAFPTPSRVPPRGAIQYAAKPEAEPDSPPVRRPVGRPRKNAPALLAAAFPTPSRPAGPASAPTTSQRPLKRPRPRASSATRDHDAFVDDDDLDEFGRPGDLESLSPVQRTAQRKLSQAQVRQQLAARSLPSPPSTSNGRTAAAKVTSKESRVVSAFASATVDSGGRAKKVRRVVEEDSDDDPLASWSN